MTYITYEKAQYSDYKMKRKINFLAARNGKLHRISMPEGVHRYSQPPKKIPIILPKPDFMPSYLVRTSDMKLVPGSQVHEGYCALSYSWNQSGEIIENETTGKCNLRIDQGRHKIVFPAKTIRKKPRGRKRIPGKIKFVTFEGIIQEICKDFNIEYIWYDQMCIDQTDEKRKHSEIRQMHKIYSNAYCTIALVPELATMALSPYPGRPLGVAYVDDSSLLESQWMKRIWTLEETLMSSKMLLIGSDTHCWWYHLSDCGLPIFDKEFDSDAARVLYYAHSRTSTKTHDRVFALANIFPDVLKEITVDYKQDIHELMTQFYGLLAKQDLSILCFGSYRSYKTMCRSSSSNSIIYNSMKSFEYGIPIQDFDLPSWTGVHGQHFNQSGYKTSFKNYTVRGRALNVTSIGVTNNQRCTEVSAPLTITLKDIPRLPQTEPDDGSSWQLVVRVRPQGFMTSKSIGLYNAIGKNEQARDIIYEDIVEHLEELSHFMPINKKNIRWVPSSRKLSTAWFSFYNLVETLRHSDQYVLLTGIRFTNPNRNLIVRYPVIKKDGDYYKVIGLCRVKGGDEFWNDIASEEQMFEIH